MRYLVKARLKPGQERPLAAAIQSRVNEGGVAQWVETCFCATPLDEERPYWGKYFQLLSIKDAHARTNCRHENGTEPWACCDCDCTAKLEARLKDTGKSFLQELQKGIEIR
jgi:hypothetical protein